VEATLSGKLQGAPLEQVQSASTSSAVASRPEVAILPFSDYYGKNILRSVACSYPQDVKAAQLKDTVASALAEATLSGKLQEAPMEQATPSLTDLLDRARDGSVTDIVSALQDVPASTLAKLRVAFEATPAPTPAPTSLTPPPAPTPALTTVSGVSVVSSGVDQSLPEGVLNNTLLHAYSNIQAPPSLTELLARSRDASVSDIARELQGVSANGLAKLAVALRHRLL
jgi:hypothetical protein